MAFNTGHSITCCKDCTERYEACWGTCEKYIKQRAEYDAKKAESRKKADIEHGITESICDSIHKTTKRRIYRSKYRKGR